MKLLGVAQSIICSPMELVKTRLQIQQQQVLKGPWACLSHIYRAEGLRGVFRGLSVTALREGPGVGAYFLIYEFLTRSNDNAPISTLHMLMAGGLAGSGSWLLAYPVDVIKTRLQVSYIPYIFSISVKMSLACVGTLFLLVLSLRQCPGDCSYLLPFARFLHII